MPEQTITEVFRADLNAELNTKEALKDLDTFKKEVIQSTKEIQTALSSISVKMPFKTWRTEIKQIAQELAAVAMPKAMRFDVSTKQLDQFVGRIKQAADEAGVSFEQMKQYIIENAKAFNTYGRAGTEAFVEAVRKMSVEVVGQSIIPDMTSAIIRTLGSIPGKLSAEGEYGPFTPIAHWAAQLSPDVKMQVEGVAEGLVEGFAGLRQEAGQTVFTMEQARERVFDVTGGFSGLMGVIQSVRDGWRLMREEGGNVGVGLSMIAGAAIEVTGKLGEKSAVMQKVNEVLQRGRPIIDAIGNTINRFRDAAESTNQSIDRLSKQTARLTEQLKLQGQVWKKQSLKGVQDLKDELKKTTKQYEAMQAALEEEIELSGEFSAKTEELRTRVQRLAGAVADLKEQADFADMFQVPIISQVASGMGKLDTLATHLATTWDATSKISRERLEDLRDTLKDVQANVAKAQAMGVVIDPGMAKTIEEIARQTARWTAEEKKATRELEKQAKIDDRAMRHEKAAEASKKSTAQMRRFASQATTSAHGMDAMQTGFEGTSASMDRFSMSVGSTLSVIAGIGGILGQLNPAFAGVIVGVAQMADRFVNAIRVMQAAASTGKDRIKAGIVAIGSILTGFGTVATAAIVSTGQLAMGVETLGITLDTVAKRVGAPAEFITAKLDELKSSGITTKNAMMSLTAFLKAELPVDNLKGLADAAKDVAVTLPQMTSSEVMQRFVTIIQSGNSALLDALNIQKTANMMVEEYRKEQGILKGALTIRQKQEAITAGLIKEAANLQGVYNAAMKTAGKQLSSMVRYWEELRLKIGQEFLPILTEVVFVFSGLLKKLQNMKPETLKFITSLVALTAIFGTLLGGILLLMPALTSVVGLFGSIGATVTGLLPVFLALSAVIVGISAAFSQLSAEGEGVEGILNRLKIVIGEITQVWDYFWNRIVMARWPMIREGIQNVIDTIRDFAAEHESTFAVLQEAWILAKDLVYTIMEVVDEVLGALGDLLNFRFDAFWEHLQEAGIKGLAWLSEAFQDFVLRAYDWGYNMIGQLAVGLIDSAREAIPAAVTYVGDMVSLFLAGASPPKKGPLKKVRSWGRNLGETFGAGMGGVNISAHLGAVGAGFTDLRGKAKDWGRNMVGTFAEGIAGKASDAIAPAMEVVGEQVSRFLEGRSPPEEGRLAEIHNWGQNVMEAFMEGFSMADFGLFDQTLGMIEQRIRMVVGTGKEQGAQLAQAMLDMRGKVAEAVSVMRAGGPIDVSQIASTIFENVTTPVIDILQVTKATLEAELAKEAVSAIQAQVAAAKEARRKEIEGIQDVIQGIRDQADAGKEGRQKQIQAVQDTIQAIQDEINAAKETRQAQIEAIQDSIQVMRDRVSDLKDKKEELEAAIIEEAKARAAEMGIVIDPRTLKRLENELKSASLKVKKQEAALQKLTARRERYGIDMLSWEEVSLMAAVDLAKQKQSEAQIAVDEEKERIARVEEIEDALRAARAAEFEAIEAEVERIEKRIADTQKVLKLQQRADREVSKLEQERLKSAQDRLKQLQRADQEASKAHQARLKAAQDQLKALQRADRDASRGEQERIRAAQQHAQALAKEAALQQKALQERLKAEELYAKMAQAAAAAAEEAAEFALGVRERRRIGGEEEGAGFGEEEMGIMPVPSEQLRSRLEELREVLRGGPKAILGAIVAGVYSVAKSVLARFGIDLDAAIAGARQKWENIKTFFAGLKEKWDTAIGKAKELLQPLTDAAGRLWDTLKGFADDPAIKEAWADLGAAWDELKTALGELKTEALEPLMEALGELWETLGPLIIETGLWKAVLVPLLPIAIALGGAFALLVGVVSALARGLKPLTKIVSGLIKTLAGVVEILAGIISLDPKRIKKGLEKIFEGQLEAAEGFLKGIVGVMAGFAEGILDALGLDSIVDAWGEFSVQVRQKVEDFVAMVVGFFVDLYNDLVGASIVVDIISGIVRLFGELPSKIATALSGLVTSIGEKFLEVAAAATGWAADLITNFVNGITANWAQLTTKITEITDKIGEIGSYIITNAYNWGYNLLVRLYSGITAYFATFSLRIQTIKNKISEIGTHITTYAYNWGYSLLVQLYNGITGYWAVFSFRVTEIKNKISEIGTYVATYAYNWGYNLLVQIYNGVMGYWEVFSLKILDIKNKIDGIGDIVSRAYNWGWNLLTNMYNGIVARWDYWNNKIQNIKDGILEIGSIALNNAYSWGWDLLTNMYDGIVARWDYWNDKVDNIKDGIREIGTIIINNAYTWGYNLLQKIKDGIENRWTTFTGKFGPGTAENRTGILGELMKIGDLVSDAYDWGKNLIQNLRDGIHDAWENVLSPKIVDLADWLRTLLGFESAPEEGPLSGAGDWGLNMMKTIAEGMATGRGSVLSEVATLANQLAGGINVPVTAAMGGAAAMGAITVQFEPVLNFYGQVSPEEVKAAVIEAPSEIDWWREIRR